MHICNSKNNNTSCIQRPSRSGPRSIVVICFLKNSSKIYPKELMYINLSVTSEYPQWVYSQKHTIKIYTT